MKLSAVQRQLSLARSLHCFWFLIYLCGWNLVPDVLKIAVRTDSLPGSITPFPLVLKDVRGCFPWISAVTPWLEGVLASWVSLRVIWGLLPCLLRGWLWVTLVPSASSSCVLSLIGLTGHYPNLWVWKSDVKKFQPSESGRENQNEDRKYQAHICDSKTRFPSPGSGQDEWPPGLLRAY